jgi:uncharacterized protein (TIGR02145 family)/uncharacterized repeat protein (TIGR02543 family)
MPANAVTVTANFETISVKPTTYTVTFNINYSGGTNPTNGTTGTDGKLTTLPTPTRSGYTLAGWFTAATGGTQVSTSTVFTANTTIYAQWTANSVTPSTYTITFNINYTGGTNPASDTTGTDGKLTTLPAPTRSGYTLTGWFTAATGGTQVSTSTVFNANTTIYAQWTADPVNPGAYTITFNINYTGGTNPASGTTGTDGKLATLPTPATRTEYTFEGWFTTSGTGGTQVTTSTVFAANTVIYARWAAVSYTITYDLNGGTVATANPTSYTSASSAITLNKPTKANYTFAGWTGTGLTGATVSVTIPAGSTGNRSYTATWKEIPVIEKETFTDSRDGTEYKYVTIGGKKWMADNLNYEIADGTESWCYNNKPDSCAKYGRLYTWNTAMGGSSSSTKNPSGVQGVCPEGWHLPSRAEWDVLMTAVGGSSTAGKALKSTSGWSNNGNGTDEFGFLALPGGRRYSGGYFDNAGRNGNWWTATEDGSGYAYGRVMYYNNGYVDEDDNNMGYGNSVRCVGDD